MTQRLASRVVLVGWSAADWQFLNPLLDAGRLPALQSLVDRGVKGDLAALSPLLPPVLWTSIATGQLPERHGILGELEPDEATGATRLASSGSRKSSALWNICDRAGLRTLAVNWYASQPAEPVAGAIVSNLFPIARAAYGQPWPLPAACVHPRSLSETLAELRVHAGDFAGDDLLAFLPQLARVDQHSDNRPLALAVALAHSVTVHGAATWLMENEPWDLLAVHYSALAAICREFMPLAGGDEAEIYRDVAANVFCYHDAMLGRLVELAGPETAFVLVSEHGYQPAGPRPYGVFCTAGPGLRRDELVFGAGLLDITPFVLTLLGLPAGEDMPGRILAEAFENPMQDVRIPTWELPALPAEADDDWDRDAAMAELAGLGYVEPRLEGSASVAIQNDGTLAHRHIAERRFAAAIPLLERIVGFHPTPEARLALAYCYQAESRPREALTQLESVPEHPHAWLIRAHLAVTAGEPESAFGFLQEAARRGAGSAVLQHRTAMVYAKLGRWAEAEQCYARAVELDERFQPGHVGRARALLELQRNQEAAATALDAVNLRFDDADAHFLLGAALARQGRASRAIQALEASVRYRPTAAAHQWLAELSEKALLNPAKARYHRQRVAELAARA